MKAPAAILANSALALLLSATMTGQANSHGSMASERRWAAEHVAGVPGDIRRDVEAHARACSNQAAAAIVPCRSKRQTTLSGSAFRGLRLRQAVFALSRPSLRGRRKTSAARPKLQLGEHALQLLAIDAGAVLEKGNIILEDITLEGVDAARRPLGRFLQLSGTTNSVVFDSALLVVFILLRVDVLAQTPGPKRLAEPQKDGGGARRGAAAEWHHPACTSAARNRSGERRWPLRAPGSGAPAHKERSKAESQRTCLKQGAERATQSASRRTDFKSRRRFEKSIELVAKDAFSAVVLGPPYSFSSSRS
ncbi:hypothetical protein Q2941_11185 [Bradyrhizobium sp. UFLA05-153]